MKNILGPVLILLIGISCSNDTERTTFQNNLENADIWINTHTIKEGTAHSGNFASRLDPETLYSVGFNQAFSRLGEQREKVNVSFWVYSKEPDIDAKLAISVMDSSLANNKFYKAIPIAEVHQPNKWNEFQKYIILPKDIEPTDILRIYVWNEEKETLYIDDMEIILE